MIKTEHTEVWGFEGAIRGARNPLNSWEKSDSIFLLSETTGKPMVEIGPNDLGLLKKLCKAGNEHRKFMRQIFISMDITAPFYWWKQFDTYKIGTVSNSCSTMHKLTYKEFTRDDFSTEHLLCPEFFDSILKQLNYYRSLYLNYDEKSVREIFGRPVSKKEIWWQMIELLPESYNQKRTITMNYENALIMIRQRHGHKLDEWNLLIDELKALPFMSEICGFSENC